MKDILEDPTRSFNYDEIFILLSPGKQEVLTTMGSKDVHLIQKCAEKSGVTVMAITSATGWILPPFIIYPYEWLQNWMAKDKMPPGFEVSSQRKDGWLWMHFFLVASPMYSKTEDQKHKIPCRFVYGWTP